MVQPPRIRKTTWRPTSGTGWPPSRGIPRHNSQALQTIYHSGGHFVLCLEDKRPVWRSWQKLRLGADALHDPEARSRRWPRDLFELAGLPAVTLPGAVKTPTYSYKPSDQSRQTWAAAAAALEMETIKRGSRNVKLFDAVRFWAYSIPRGQALEQNRRFPEPLGESEVKQTAYSISTWCWSGGGARWHFDHSSAAQRRRGIKSGKVRRARNAERDAAIVAAVEAGQSMRAVARGWGVHHKTVLHVVNRRVGNEPNQWVVWGAEGGGSQLGLL